MLIGIAVLFCQRFIWAVVATANDKSKSVSYGDRRILIGNNVEKLSWSGTAPTVHFLIHTIVIQFATLSLIYSLAGPEYGTTEAAWKGILTEADRLSDLHLKVKENLCTDVMHQIKAWQKDNYHKVN